MSYQYVKVLIANRVGIIEFNHKRKLNALSKVFIDDLMQALHDLNQAMGCDRVAVLHQGRLLAIGPPADVLTPACLRDVFGVEALIESHPLHGYPRITWITRP